MKKYKIYEYKNCSTCKKALKFLDQKKIAYEKIDITEAAPSIAELKQMLMHLNGEFKRLFNTSGLVYKEMKLSEKIPGMEAEAALRLLSKNGRLVKRPFILGDTIGLVGFKEADWAKL